MAAKQIYLPNLQKELKEMKENYQNLLLELEGLRYFQNMQQRKLDEVHKLLKEIKSWFSEGAENLVVESEDSTLSASEEKEINKAVESISESMRSQEDSVTEFPLKQEKEEKSSTEVVKIIDQKVLEPFRALDENALPSTEPQSRKRKAENPFENEIICSDCGLMFNRNPELLHHLRNGTCKHYICEFDQCGKKFRSNSTLKNHQALHTGSPTKCPECGNMYPCEQFMIRHFKRNHEKENNAGGKPKADTVSPQFSLN